MSDDLRFDQLLREDASGLPPAMADVNPWREAMWLVLWGMGLTTITFHFLYLDLLLPALGGILMVLGFRTLRQENKALRWCWRLSIVIAAVRSASFVLAALPVDVKYVPAYAIMAMTFALYIGLWRGMVGVSRAAGAEKPAAPAAGALVIFYVVLGALAFLKLEGWLGSAAGADRVYCDPAESGKAGPLPFGHGLRHPRRTGAPALGGGAVGLSGADAGGDAAGHVPGPAVSHGLAGA